MRCLLRAAAAVALMSGSAQAAEIFVASGPGGGDVVEGYSTAPPALFGFGQLNGPGARGVNIAAYGDDGGVTLVVGNQTGGGRVGVFDIRNFGQLGAFETGFAGGVSVAAGDLNGDGRADIIVGADAQGGPRVQVYDGATLGQRDGPSILYDFFAGDPQGQTVGGIQVGAGDLNGDGFADLVVGAGPDGGPRVQVFDGLTLGARGGPDVLHDFFAFDQGFTGGVSVAVGRENGLPTLIVGQASGGSRINVFNPFTRGLLHDFHAFAPGFLGGVRVSAGEYGDQDAIIVGAGPGGLPTVNIYGEILGGRAQLDGQVDDPFGLLASFDAVFTGAQGVNVAGLFTTPPPVVDGGGGVPEPMTWALMLTGFAGLGGALRRRRALA